MKKIDFYDNAARYGLLLGAAEAAFTALDAWKSSPLISLADLAVFVTLLTIFTGRRATRCALRGENCSYGRRLAFILCMSLFAGVLTGAYSIVASNFLYPDKYHQLIDRIINTLSMTGLYADAMLDHMRSLYEKVFFSPLWVVLTNMLSMAFKGLLFGLFVAAFTRREPYGGRRNDMTDRNI